MCSQIPAFQPAQRTDGPWANRNICRVALVEKANVLSPFVLVVQTSLPWGSLMPLQFIFNPDGFWYSESGGICCATGEKKLKKRSWTTSKLCKQMGIFHIWLEGRLLMEVPAHMVKIHLLDTHTVCNWPLCCLLYAILGVMIGGNGRNCLQELLQPFPSSCKGSQIGSLESWDSILGEILTAVFVLSWSSALKGEKCVKYQWQLLNDCCNGAAGRSVNSVVPT